MDIKEIKRKALPVFAPYHPSRVGLFGSAARGDMRSDSDIDFLIEIDPKYNLFDVIGLKLDLEKVLKKKVDLVEYSQIKPLLRKTILHEAIDLL